MRALGEQWVEEIDGKKHMVKAVKGVEGEKLCTACIFKPRIYPDYSKIRHDTVQTQFRCAYGVLCPIEEGYIKDLGPVDEEGLLACPFCGSNLNIISCHDGFYARCCNNDCALGVTDSFVEKQDLIDACNRRN